MRIPDAIARLVDSHQSVASLRSAALELAFKGRFLGGSLRHGCADASAPWPMVTVNDVGVARLGKMLDGTKNRGSPRPYLRNVNVRWFGFDLSDLKEMRFEDDELEILQLRPGDVLICEGGEPGRAAVWTNAETPMYFQKALHRVRLGPAIMPDYFVLALRVAASKGTLADQFTGATFLHLTGVALSRFRFPKPPIEEQRRIVAKVDALMALCDELESAQTCRDEARDRLRAASLAQLTAPAATPGKVDQKAATFVLSHSDRMVTRKEHVDQLRGAVLDLAIQGKLVPQDRAEEPATTWLEQIAGVTPRSTDQSAMPAGWVNVELGDVTPLVTSGSRDWAQYYSDTGALFVRSQNVRNGFLNLADRAHVNPPHNGEGTRTRVRLGDLLLVITGDVGHVGLWERDLGEAYVSQHLALARPVVDAIGPWLLRALMSPGCGQRQLRSGIYGGKPGLNLTQIRQLEVPLPPLPEQQRIVAKVDELMAVCDQLEASVAAAETGRVKLLEALLSVALEETGSEELVGAVGK